LNEESAAPGPSDTITVIEAFDAMRLFLSTIWKRQGGGPEELAFVIGAAAWEDGTPADPELWGDRLLAVRACKSPAP
jgi:hypothetical protein